MKKVIAINGSPRKKGNTATLLKNALEGATAAGTETEMVNLYDLNFKGCVSCFACKRKGVTVETCVVKDDLKPVLERIHQSDAVVLGSPMYFGDVTGEIRSFYERLMFPYLSYEGKPSSFGRKINSAYIYTMNLPESYLDLPDFGYNEVFKHNEQYLKMMLGNSETLISTETLQFKDYSKYAIASFGKFIVDEAEKIKRHQTVFAEDCRKAFELGKRLVG